MTPLDPASAEGEEGEESFRTFRDVDAAAIPRDVRAAEKMHRAVPWLGSA